MLSSFFAIYTEGEALPERLPSLPGTEVIVEELKPLVLPGASDELFGPYANEFLRFKPKRGFLVGFRRTRRGRADGFFTDVRNAVLGITRGLSGFAVDVLRLWPFPLAQAAEALPEHHLAEDLFSVGFTDMGQHGMRAETIGLSKLGQPELTFTCADRALMEEAALLCGHLADWLLEHARRFEAGQNIAFGFDRLTFLAPEGTSWQGFRGWHPPLVQKLIPEKYFDGVGVLEMRAVTGEGVVADLTAPLRRSLDQRTLLEAHDLTGDSPHSGATAELEGAIVELKDVQATREEPNASKDSGWRFRRATPSARTARETRPLAELVTAVPELLRYLALPTGVRVAWDAHGIASVDRSRVVHDDDDGLDDDHD